MRENVLIAVPTLTGKLSASIAYLFTLAHKLNAREGPFTYHTTTAEGISGHALARNNIVQQFRKGNYDRLWMIDDDIVVEAEAFGLLDVDADIVAPLMPIYKLNHDRDAKRLNVWTGYAAFRFHDLDDMNSSTYADLEFGTGIQEVDAAGFGCTIIRAALLRDERLLGNLEFTRLDGRRHTLTETDPPPLFQTRTLPNGEVDLGEDVDFCLRAKKLGYRVAVDTGIEVGHVKPFDIRYLIMLKKHYEDLFHSVTPATV